MMTTAGQHAAPGELEERMIAAACACFERYGIAKTTVEDIARGAKVSRQTVYRYFTGKDDIIDTICVREAAKINQVVRREIRRDMDFAATLTQALFIIITEGNKNPILRQTVESVSFQALAASAGSRSHQLNLGYWKDMMARAAERGELAGDISLDEIVAWMTMMQSVLQSRLADGVLDEAALHRVIARFIVKPLLP